MRAWFTIGHALVLTVALLHLTAQSTAAQDLGVRAGASGDPDQVYFGVHGDAGPVVEDLRFRPNLELGVGDGTTLTAFNIEFVYPLEITDSPWRVYPGVGPAVNIFSHNNRTDVNGGLNILIGLEHERGFFVELKVGLFAGFFLSFALDFPKLSACPP